MDPEPTPFGELFRQLGLVKISKIEDISGSPVDKNSPFYCRECGFYSWSGN